MLHAFIDAGRLAVANAGVNNESLEISKVEIGTQAAFTPDPAGSGVIPAVSQTLPGTCVYKTAVTKEEVVITVKIGSKIEGPVGNVMVYLEGDIPFVWLALPFVYHKAKTNDPEASAGDKYFLHYRLYYPKLAKTLSLLPDFYASMDYYPDFPAVLEAKVQPYFQYVVNNNNERVVVVSKLNNIWWGIPWMQRIDDARFFAFDGGDAGDNYKYVFTPKT